MGVAGVEQEGRAARQSLGADPSLKSFLFTLKNPHNVTARRFALKPEMKELAIGCDAKWGLFFNGIHVAHNGNRNTRSFTSLGYSYINDIGLDGETFFTGSVHFKVKEIEVFEITE
jgi:phosphopantetheinyl transferase (holo-ACP synthase)